MLDAIQRRGSASRILWGCALAALLTACSGGASSTGPGAIIATSSSSSSSSSSIHAQKNTPPPTDKSISMVLTEHYGNKNYDYTCNPTLESQKELKLTSFDGSLDIPGQQKEMPPANLPIKLQDPPSTWYCTMKSPAQK